ncbi:unnamed protein product [Alopecurus aequalis]
METAADGSRRCPALRLLCPKTSILAAPFPSLLWLVGSPRFLQPVTVAATLRCLRCLPDDGAYSPSLPHEADEIRGLLVRGFDIVGALLVGSANFESDAGRALELAHALRERLFGERASHGMVGGCVDAATGDIRFLISESIGSEAVEGQEVVWEDEPERLLLENGCLLRCQLPLQLPLYLPLDEKSDAIQITVLSNQKFNSSKAGSPVPVLKYFPASANLRVINLKLDILCYTSIDLPVAAAVSELVIPGLFDQLSIMKKAIVSELLTQQPQLCPYHFVPPGLLIPLTAIYDSRYGEIEEKQSELRRNLHLRLGLPLDRPLLRTSNALMFGGMIRRDKNISKNGSSILRDVHKEIPSSGVSGGIMSLIDGSYEYYHYFHDGIDDNGWGCAYRSLQTIISWYRLQQYSSINVLSHREIQQVLVEIGDKDPSFVGSREWIGAIELSFVLDKLLGVSCRIINVRSGDELPEKCREIARHFETQGTPVMIGGGVLAYTLLGVDYNESSGDCAFLILDPHYTGADDLKKIVNGGWCAWKKSVDNKGRSFFLKDKFYNLLLPQRPNMV